MVSILVIHSHGSSAKVLCVCETVQNYLPQIVYPWPERCMMRCDGLMIHTASAVRRVVDSKVGSRTSARIMQWLGALIFAAELLPHQRHQAIRAAVSSFPLNKDFRNRQDLPTQSLFTGDGRITRSTKRPIYASGSTACRKGQRER